jgi:hypothetical protein
VSLGILELCGRNMPYSKFSQVGSQGLSSCDGMLLSYATALLIVLKSFAVPGAADGLCAADDSCSKQNRRIDSKSK